MSFPPAPPDPRDVLGVPADATFAEVHRAFRRKLVEHPPDTRRPQGEAAGSESDEALQRLLAAYEELRREASGSGGSQPSTAGRHAPDERRRVAPAQSAGPVIRASAVRWEQPTTARGTGRAREDGPATAADILVRWLLGR
jgi:hypothetical protein